MEPMVNIALRAARKAGNLIARASDDLTRLRFEAKGKADFVTEVDLASERELIFNLQKTYPDHAFLCEESGRTGPEDAEYLWIIDPLDGTSNFMRGIPHYCISIACTKAGKVEHAVVLDPVRQEEFTASRGRGAQLNGRRLRVSDRIRENLRKIRKMSPLGVIDVSLNETLGRTLVTSLTTMLVLTSLAILGGDMIFGFAVALLVGVSVGTYSSIYVASTSLLALGVTKEDVAIPVKEGEDQDAIAP